MATDMEYKMWRKFFRSAFDLNVLTSTSYDASGYFAQPTRLSILAALTILISGSIAVAQSGSTAKTDSTATAVTNKPAATQTNSATEAALDRKPLDLRLGPFALHPRLSAGLTYDDNILLAANGAEADTEWLIRPAVQAVAGDDAALIEYRDKNYDVLSVAPGILIVQQPDVWPGKLLIMDYGPGFQLFDKYTVNNHIDEFGTLNLLLPMNKLILGLRQDYQSLKTEIIEFDRRATVDTISTVLSAGYQFGEATSMESDFRRISVDYDQTGLTGYTEYNTEDWFNYKVAESLPVSIGVLAGQDDVANHQNQTFEQLRGRARYNYTEKLVFDVSAGGELRQYENGKGETLYPVFSVVAEYHPAVRTTLRLTGFRQQYASIFNGYNYINTGTSLYLRQGITERFTADFSAGYYDLDYLPAIRGPVQYTGDYYFVRASLEEKLVRHLTGQVFYQFLNLKSQVNGDVNDNQTGVQLTLSY
jgi:hypothetical protein